MMQADYNETKHQFPNEPETRVKHTVHQALTAEFKSLIQQSQQSASNFKDTVRNKLKRFIGLYKRDASDEQLEKLCDDPEAAKKLM
jgi:t-SNARE complex subunit (syntaxin)